MKSRHILQNLLLSVGILSAGFGISLLLQQISSSPELVSLVFVLAVFLISLWTQGYIWGILASMASVLIDNFIFTFPYFAFDFLTPENLIAALVMLAVATVTSTLTTKIKEQERIRAETETEKMRGNLLRAISHDLRTPLTTIYGSTSAIIENYDSLSRSQQIRLLCEIREDSQSLIRMVENLLSVTRVNGEAVHIRKNDTVLEEIITNKQKALYLLDFRAFTGFFFCSNWVKNQQKINRHSRIRLSGCVCVKIYMSYALKSSTDSTALQFE